MGSVEAFVDAILQWAPCPPIAPASHSKHLEALFPLGVQDSLVKLLESYADGWPPAFLVAKVLKSLISFLERDHTTRYPAASAAVEGACEAQELEINTDVVQPVSDSLYELWCYAEARSPHAGGKITFPLRLDGCAALTSSPSGEAYNLRVSAWKAARFSDVATNIWPALFVLVEFMLLLPLTYEDLRGLFSGRTALELGAGTGIAGIMLQRALSRLPAPTDVIVGRTAAFGNVELTDGEAVSVELIARNIAENAAVDAAATSLHASQLRWALDGDSERHAKPNMIIFGSDLIYDPIDVPALVCTVHAHLSPLPSPLPSALASPSAGSDAHDKAAEALSIIQALHTCGGSFAILANTYREPSSFALYERTLTNMGLHYIDATDLFTHMSREQGAPIIVTFATVWDALRPQGEASGTCSKRDTKVRVHIMWKP
jgi:hypothetical protein